MPTELLRAAGRKSPYDKTGTEKKICSDSNITSPGVTRSPNKVISHDYGKQDHTRNTGERVSKLLCKISTVAVPRTVSGMWPTPRGSDKVISDDYGNTRNTGAAESDSAS